MCNIFISCINFTFRNCFNLYLFFNFFKIIFVIDDENSL